MMKRRIFLWMGLIVLFLSFGLSGEALAKEAAYKVKRGDSISIIAKKNGVTIEALQETNGLNGNTLKTGQFLVIPKRVKQKTAKKSPLLKSPSYRVKKGDNLYGIARKTGFSVSEIKEANNLRSNNLKIGQKIILSKKADTGREETAKYAAKSTEMDDSEEDGGLVDGADVFPETVEGVEHSGAGLREVAGAVEDFFFGAVAGSVQGVADAVA